MDKRFRRTTLLIAFSVALVLGVASTVSGLKVSGLYVVLSLPSVVVSYRKYRLPALVSLILFGALLGNWRGGIIADRLQPLTNLYDQRVVITATADTDGSYINNSQLAFDATNITITDPIRVSVPGKLKIEGFGENAVFRGDVVQVEGKLQDTLGSRQGRLSFADVMVLGRNGSAIEKVRHNFTAGMQSALPEPQASFAMGLLIGQKTTLPKEVGDNLSAVGLTHIIAVSGYNLTIIVMAVRRLLRNRSKYQTTIGATILVVAFVLLTGFSASIVRAAIVSMLSLIAWYYGRTFRPLLLITFTAALTALWNPLYVWTDAGWYMSFLAFYGVLVLAPLIHQRLPGAKRRGTFGHLVIESVSAQVMVAPYILYVFNQLSLFALPANVLIVPLVPIAMALSLMAGLAGMAITSVAGWFAWPAKIVLTYMLDVSALFARIPHAAIQRSLPFAGLLLLYAAIILVSVSVSRQLANHATITDINS